MDTNQLIDQVAEFLGMLLMINYDATLALTRSSTIRQRSGWWYVAADLHVEYPNLTLFSPMTGRSILVLG